MIKHYLKVAFRNLAKYKTQTLVSIIGLAVGFTCFALSVLWLSLIHIFHVESLFAYINLIRYPNRMFW